MTPGIVWAHLWRASVAVVVVSTTTVAAYLSGLAGQPRAWLWTPAALGLGAAAVACALWWRRPGQHVALAVVVPLAVALGAGAWVRSPPGTGVLAATLDRLELPSQARLVAQSNGGNVLCFDVCTTVRRRYRLPTDRAPAQVADALRQSLRDVGFALEDPAGPRSFSTSLEDTELHVTGRVEPVPEHAGVVVRLRAVAGG